MVVDSVEGKELKEQDRCVACEISTARAGRIPDLASANSQNFKHSAGDCQPQSSLDVESSRRADHASHDTRRVDAARGTVTSILAHRREK